MLKTLISTTTNTNIVTKTTLQVQIIMQNVQSNNLLKKIPIKMPHPCKFIFITLISSHKLKPSEIVLPLLFLPLPESVKTIRNCTPTSFRNSSMNYSNETSHYISVIFYLDNYHQKLYSHFFSFHCRNQ